MTTDELKSAIESGRSIHGLVRVADPYPENIGRQVCGTARWSKNGRYVVVGMRGRVNTRNWYTFDRGKLEDVAGRWDLTPPARIMVDRRGETEDGAMIEARPRDEIEKRFWDAIHRATRMFESQRVNHLFENVRYSLPTTVFFTELPRYGRFEVSSDDPEIAEISVRGLSGGSVTSVEIKGRTSGRVTLRMSAGSASAIVDVEVVARDEPPFRFLYCER